MTVLPVRLDSPRVHEVRVIISNCERSRENLRVGDAPVRFQDGVATYVVTDIGPPADHGSDSCLVTLRRTR